MKPKFKQQQTEKKSKKTYKELDKFRQIAEIRLLGSNPEKESKLNLCIAELIGNPKKGEVGSFHAIGENYNREVKKIYRKHAGTDEKGFILKDANNNYIFTKETEELVDKELEDLYASTIEFLPAYCPTADLPNDLLPSEKIIYKGFVIA